MVGQIVAQYEILEKIGVGGMGEVYRARDTRLGREVALKIMPPDMAGDTERRSRFEREARAVATLNHPNIVTLYAVEEHDDTVYLSMELVAGQSLAEIITDTGLPLERFLAIAIPLAEAVSYAHRQGITHRDLKPANIMVTPDGQVKVLDFGLAKLLETSTTPDGATMAMDDHATREGHILGTAAYMSPEQAEGKPVDHRCDIFSLGAIMYEMITGQRPFQGDSDISTLSSVLRDTPPPVTELKQSLPYHLGHVVRRCLAKSPDRRFQSALDIRNELLDLQEQPLLEQSTVTSQLNVATKPRRKGIPGLVVALLVLAGVVGGALLGRTLLGSGTPGTSSSSAAAFPVLTQLTDSPGPELFPTIAPDGKHVCYESGSNGNKDIYLLRVGGDNPRNLTAGNLTNDSRPSFSPDGEFIAFRSDRDGGGLYVMGATGESVRRLTDFGHNPSWSPDGREIYFATEGINTPYGRMSVSELWAVDVSTAETRLVYAGDAVQPVPSPSGHRIAFWALRASGQRDLWTVRPDGTELVNVLDDPPTDWNPFWSSDGGTLYFSSDRGGSMGVWQLAIDEISGQVLGPPEPVITSVANRVEQASISRDGQHIAFASLVRKSHLYRLALDPESGTANGQAELITAGTTAFGDPDISPDGQWIAFVRSDPPEDIFVSRVDGTERRRLTNDSFKDRRPRWSRDGSRLAFYSDRAGSYDIWSILPDGRGLTRLTETDGMVNMVSWSPDDALIASYEVEAGNSILFSTTGPQREADFQYLPPPPYDGQEFHVFDWSADGKQLAGVIAGQDGLSRGIATYDIATQSYTRHRESGWAPHWIPGTDFLVVHERSIFFTLNLVTGEVTTLYSLGEANMRWRHSVSQDGRWLYFSGQHQEADIWLQSSSGGS